MTTDTATHQPWAERWQRLSSAFLRAFHRYANWLVGISWKRFIVLSVLLMIFAAILSELSPFSWSVTETIEHTTGQQRKPPVAPATPGGPIVQEALTGSADRAATYQDLLKSPHDEAIFTHYATSQLARITIDNADPVKSIVATSEAHTGEEFGECQRREGDDDGGADGR